MMRTAVMPGGTNYKVIIHFKELSLQMQLGNIDSKKLQLRGREVGVMTKALVAFSVVKNSLF